MDKVKELLKAYICAQDYFSIQIIETILGSNSKKMVAALGCTLSNALFSIFAP